MQLDHLNELKAAKNISHVIDKKVTSIVSGSMTSISKKTQLLERKAEMRPQLLKNVLSTTFGMIKNKMRRAKEEAFRAMWKFETSQIREVDEEADLINKGRRLLALKEFPRLNMRRAFWRWYLSQTAVGRQNFQNLADNLVLHTNVNRTTVLYRLKTATFGKKFHVSPMLKRKIVMLTATMKLFFRKHKK